MRARAVAPCRGRQRRPYRPPHPHAARILPPARGPVRHRGALIRLVHRLRPARAGSSPRRSRRVGITLATVTALLANCGAPPDLHAPETSTPASPSS
ncbi:MAG TPA: hypothetical protein VIL44_00735, partial [Micromonospora sp.]